VGRQNAKHVPSIVVVDLVPIQSQFGSSGRRPQAHPLFLEQTQRGDGHRPSHRIVMASAKMKTYGPFERELLKFMGDRQKVVVSEFLASSGFLAMLDFHPDDSQC
jgi:hypothetical protein